jgi:hypothetical protein
MNADRTASRRRFRVGLFRRRDYSAAKAEALANLLARRDADHDDRRVCLECQHLQQDGFCSAAARGLLFSNTSRRFQPIRDLLQRCEGFKWVAP